MKISNVEDEYKKFPELIKSEVLKFVEWSKHQTHLPEISELEACSFLHACYFSVEVAKQTYDLYCTTRTLCPDFFGNRDILGKDMIDIMNTIAIYPLPHKTPEGYKVFVAKLTDLEPGKFSFADSIKCYTMCFELSLLEGGISNGIVLVMDMEGCSLGHVARFGPFTMKKFLFYLQETLPIRLKGLHFVNAVSFVDKILAIMRPFMKKELMDMLHIHTAVDSFYEFIPKEILPIEYGGCDGSMNASYRQFYEYVKENRNFFLEEERTKRTKESLRQGKPKDASDLFGIGGNFKKLDID